MLVSLLRELSGKGVWCEQVWLAYLPAAAGASGPGCWTSRAALSGYQDLRPSDHLVTINNHILHSQLNLHIFLHHSKAELFFKLILIKDGVKYDIATQSVICFHCFTFATIWSNAVGPIVDRNTGNHVNDQIWYFQLDMGRFTCNTWFT